MGAELSLDSVEDIQPEFEDIQPKLQELLESGAPEAEVLAELKGHPESAKARDDSNRLPLLIAVREQASGAVVERLLELHPEAAREKNRDQKVPLHHAAARNAPEAAVRALIKAYPEALKEEDRFGKRPLTYAVQEKEASFLPFLEADMPLSLGSGAPAHHYGTWTTCVAAEGAAGAIRRILASKDDDPLGGGFCIHIQALAEVFDNQGRTALELSASGPRQAINNHLLFCSRYELSLGAPEHRSATSLVLRATDRSVKTDYAAIFDQEDKERMGKLENEKAEAVAARVGLDAQLFFTKTGGEFIDRATFIGVCRQLLGDGVRSVVIKLMKEKTKWERERRVRKFNKLDPKYAVSELTGVPTDKEIATAVAAGSGGLSAIKPFVPDGFSFGTHAIIMDAADRSLNQIYAQEQPDLSSLRTILTQVFEAVNHLHEKGLMHGDLKLLNVVRFRLDGRLRLIDFDAAAKIVPVGAEGKSYAGAKFSSATLPPEMFFELTTDGQREQLKEYWQSEDDELRAKVAPGEIRGSNRAYVVKSFREQTAPPVFDGGGGVGGGDVGGGGEGKGDGMPQTTPVFDGLPYELVDASKKIDVWALGALAFALLAGEPLIPATRNDDCASGEAMRIVYTWGLKKDVVLTQLEKINDPAARDLVDTMLQREPLARPTVDWLLKNHAFFNQSNPDVLKQLEKQTGQLEKQTEQLEKHTEQLKQIDSKVDQVLNQLKAQFEVLSTLLHGVDTLAPKLVCFLPNDAIGNSPSSWASKSSLLNPRGWFNKPVRLFFFDPIRLTLAPTNDGEGFVLTYPKAWVAKAMPYVKLGLTALKVAYIAGRLAGFPVPNVAGVVGDWIDGQLGELSALAGEATTWLSEQTKDLALAKSMLKQLEENSRNAISGELEAIKPKDAEALCDDLTVPLKTSIEELDALLKKDHGDWRKKSGLVLATSKVDGKSEYVLEADKAAFEEKGVALIVSSKELPPSLAQQAPSTAEKSANTELSLVQEPPSTAEKSANTELTRTNNELSGAKSSSSKKNSSACCLLM